jgi:hypothetical protein
MNLATLSIAKSMWSQRSNGNFLESPQQNWRFHTALGSPFQTRLRCLIPALASHPTSCLTFSIVSVRPMAQPPGRRGTGIRAGHRSTSGGTASRQQTKAAMPHSPPLSCAAIKGARGEAFSLAPVAAILQRQSIQRILRHRPLSSGIWFPPMVHAPRCAYQ